LQTSSAKVVIAEPDLWSKIQPVAKSCGISDDNVFEFDCSSQYPSSDTNANSWKTLMQHGEEDWIRFDNLEIALSTPACRLFSSGTTGLPKAASLSHYNIIAQHTIVHEHQQDRKPYKVSDLSINEVKYRMTVMQVKRILCLPFFHAAMVPIGHTTPLKAGHVSYVMRRFDLEPFLQCTEQYSITELFLVPPVILSILQSPLIRKYSLKSLRWGLVGGAPLDVASLKNFNALMNADGRINSCWGMTECSCVGAGYHWREADVTGSIGRFLPNLEVK
jgi:4-coumarate--CoA ligase